MTKYTPKDSRLIQKLNDMLKGNYVSKFEIERAVCDDSLIETLIIHFNRRKVRIKPHASPKPRVIWFEEASE